MEKGERREPEGKSCTSDSAFSQTRSSDVLNFRKLSRNGVFRYAAFIMEAS